MGTVEKQEPLLYNVSKIVPGFPGTPHLGIISVEYSHVFTKWPNIHVQYNKKNKCSQFLLDHFKKHGKMVRAEFCC